MNEDNIMYASTSIQLRDIERARIAKDTADFLASGGTIEVLPISKYIDDPQAYMRAYKPPSNAVDKPWPINSMVNIKTNNLKSGTQTYEVKINNIYVGNYKTIEAAQISRDSTRHKLKMKPVKAG
ncbi:MAG: hypothetical protein U5M23_01400 [Marinagarivorans sp.]|nr:hypothetical protein [Marinagarivorans sp.]